MRMLKGVVVLLLFVMVAGFVSSEFVWPENPEISYAVDVSSYFVTDNKLFIRTPELVNGVEGKMYEVSKTEDGSLIATYKSACVGSCPLVPETHLFPVDRLDADEHMGFYDDVNSFSPSDDRSIAKEDDCPELDGEPENVDGEDSNQMDEATGKNKADKTELKSIDEEKKHKMSDDELQAAKKGFSEGGAGGDDVDNLACRFNQILKGDPNEGVNKGKIDPESMKNVLDLMKSMGLENANKVLGSEKFEEGQIKNFLNEWAKLGFGGADKVPEGFSVDLGDVKGKGEFMGEGDDFDFKLKGQREPVGFSKIRAFQDMKARTTTYSGEDRKDIKQNLLGISYDKGKLTYTFDGGEYGLDNSRVLSLEDGGYVGFDLGEMALKVYDEKDQVSSTFDLYGGGKLEIGKDGEAVTGSRLIQSNNKNSFPILKKRDSDLKKDNGGNEIAPTLVGVLWGSRDKTKYPYKPSSGKYTYYKEGDELLAVNKEGELRKSVVGKVQFGQGDEPDKGSGIYYGYYEGGKIQVEAFPSGDKMTPLVTSGREVDGAISYGDGNLFMRSESGFARLRADMKKVDMEGADLSVQNGNHVISTKPGSAKSSTTGGLFYRKGLNPDGEKVYDIDKLADSKFEEGSLSVKGGDGGEFSLYGDNKLLISRKSMEDWVQEKEKEPTPKTGAEGTQPGAGETGKTGVKGVDGGGGYSIAGKSLSRGQVNLVSNSGEVNVKDVAGFHIVKVSGNDCGACSTTESLDTAYAQSKPDVAFTTVKTKSMSSNLFAQQNSVFSFPTYILYKDGVEIKRQEGNFDQLKPKIQ